MIVPIDREDVRRKVQYLVDQGAQGFIVSLLWCFRNPEHERTVREVIEEEYPGYYLGAMPIILSSDVQPKRMNIRGRTSPCSAATSTAT